MPYIKIHKVKQEIEYYSKYMTLLQARKEIDWIIKNKCRDKRRLEELG